MIKLISQGQWLLFCVIMAAIVISLSFHEYGHAWVAKRFGDDTAERAGRLTLNPLAHIDPMGLLMVVFVGFGYARPVPTDPRRFTSRYADLLVAAAGPGMNLLLAVLSINVYLLTLKAGLIGSADLGPRLFFVYLAQINLLLMVFNLLPIGALDGHLHPAVFSAAPPVPGLPLLQRSLWQLCIAWVDYAGSARQRADFPNHLLHQRSAAATNRLYVTWVSRGGRYN